MRLDRGLAVDQPIALHHMKAVGVGRTVNVDHGERAQTPDPPSVDDEYIALVMADGIAVPRRCHLRRMRPVQSHLTKFVVWIAVEDGDFVGLLKELDADGPENIGRGLRPALIGRCG